MGTTVSISVLGDMSFVQLVIYGLALLVLFIFIRQRYFSVICDIPGPVLGPASSSGRFVGAVSMRNLLTSTENTI